MLTTERMKRVISPVFSISGITSMGFAIVSSISVFKVMNKAAVVKVDVRLIANSSA